MNLPIARLTANLSRRGSLVVPTGGLTQLLTLLLLLALGLGVGARASWAEEKIKALIVDGQNNHGIWPTTTQMMKGYLEESGRFTVDVATTAPQGTDPDFNPTWSDYDVVVSNYNGAPWPEATRESFEQYVENGGGLVVIHAADNAFGDWTEYNKMIGLGGWGGRNERSGPYLYLDDQGDLVRDEAAGPGGHHGAQHPFTVIVRDADHPITRGMPIAWMHERDELYDFLRGPAENVRILATAYASPDQGGSGRHEPMLMVIDYGKGRVFHTPMGHGDYSQRCVGFITSLVRGAQWAAGAEVDFAIPDDFPTEDEVRVREEQKQ
ncbi:MAG: ThuA domain-containing protein [Pirellulaceae bacterium]